MTGVELATALVVFYAPVIRQAEATGEPEFHGRAAVVMRAVMLAHGFDRDQAEVFIRTLLGRID